MLSPLNAITASNDRQKTVANPELNLAELAEAVLPFSICCLSFVTGEVDPPICIVFCLSHPDSGPASHSKPFMATANIQFPARAAKGGTTHQWKLCQLE